MQVGEELDACLADGAVASFLSMLDTACKAPAGRAAPASATKLATSEDVVPRRLRRIVRRAQLVLSLA